MTMERKAFSLDVNVTAQSQSPLLGILSTLVITQTHRFQEFIVNEKDGSLTSLGFLPASSSSSSSPPNPQIFVQLETFKPDYVYQTLHGRLHDHHLSQKLSDEIVLESQKRMSQGIKQQPLFIEALVKLTQNIFNVVPCSDHESEQEWEETTCAICLEEMLWGSEDNIQTLNCFHWFHENCFREWLNRNNSCPLCRQPVDKEPN